MIEYQLEGVLRTSSLHALVIVVTKALSRSGFGDVEILDRRTEKQKSRFGGHELQCITEIGNMPGKVIVKIVRDSVRTRMVDELAGTVLRTGADRGLIVTPFRMTKGAKENLDRYKPAQVDVVDGQSLVSMLKKHGIGIRGRGEVDFAYFGALEEFAPKLATCVRRLQ